jgi:hypothetical protein
MNDFDSGRPVVLRGGTVLPMDGRRVLPRTDVLVTGDRTPSRSTPPTASSCPA